MEGDRRGIKRKSDRFARSTEDMMEILLDDINRYEVLAEIDANTVMDEIMNGEIDEVGQDSASKLGVGDQARPITPSSCPTVRDTGAASKSRFPTVSLEDTDNFLMENANRNTLYKTKSDMKILKEWAIANNEYRDVAEIPPKELDSMLARFFLGVRKRDGSEYEPDTLTSIQNSIDRHLKNLKIATNIKLDPSFSHSRRVLEAKRKSLKAMGKGNKPKRADPLSQQELAILYDKKILGSGNPDSLLNTVWINNATHFGLRGRQEHVNLCWGDITLKTTSDDKEYLEYNERNTKTRTGAQKGDYRRVIPKMFAVPENENCPVKIYKVYQSHRPVDMNNPESRFYLRPLINPSSQVWYSHQCLGKDKLGKMMAKMANEGELAGRKVNHSTRKTFATSLVHAGISPNEIAHLGGWKNVQSINDYSVPSVEQQQQASNILSNAVIPMSHNEQTTVNSNSSNDENTSPLVYSNSVSKCTAASEEFSPFSMFAGANISGGNITINIVPPSSQKKMNFTQAQSKN